MTSRRFDVSIKICGVRDPATALVAAEAGADAIGLVFAPGSPRRLTVDRALDICRALPAAASAVAVFRDQPRGEIEAWLEALESSGAAGPDDAAPWFAALPAGAAGSRRWVQLHGREDEADAAAFAHVIKALPWDEAELRRWDGSPHVRALLVEGAEAGTGTGFDHAALAAMRGSLGKPLILAGGLGPDTVAAAVARMRPDAVDVSSGVESARGVKSHDLIRHFCAALR